MTTKKQVLWIAICIIFLTSLTWAHEVSTTLNGLNTGNMNGQSGDGVGFAEESTWSSGTSTISVRDRDLSAMTGTNYGLNQSGNTRLAQGTSSSARQQARQIAVTMDGTVWFSFLVKRASDDSRGGIGFNRTSYTPGAPRILANQSSLLLDFDPSTYDVSVPGVFTTGETALVVGKIDINAGTGGEDHVSVWVNPDVSDPGGATATQNGADFVGDGITYLNVISYHGGVSGGEVDMVFLSNDTDAYTDVTGAIFPTYAYNPNPDDGQSDVGIVNGSQVDVMLSWKTGEDPNGVLAYNPEIKKHYLYLSGDQNVTDDPNLYYEATIDVTGVDASYGPLSLNLDGLYLWRIEEGLDDGQGGVYPPGEPNNYTGLVWSFYTKQSVPVIVDSPQDTAVFVGETAELTVLANSINPITGYEWYKSDDYANNTPGDDMSVLSGATADGLTISNAQDSNEGYYYCVVSNSGGSTSSNVARLGIKRLLTHWTLDQSDTVGGQYLDIVSGYDALIQGTASPTYVPGAKGSANGAVVITDNSWAQVSGTLDPTQYTRTISISLWADWYGLNGSYQRLLCKNHSTWDVQNSAWLIGNHSNSPAINFFAYYDETGTVNLTDDTATDPNTFQHFVVTYDGTVANVYFEGKYVGTYAGSAGGDFALNYDAEDAPIGIGVGYADDGRHMFNGALDDVRIYNYALSPEEVGQLYYDVTGEPACVEPPQIGDFDNDCDVDLEDLLSGMISNWLNCGLYPMEGCL